jgi:hypothetical protein
MAVLKEMPGKSEKTWDVTLFMDDIPGVSQLFFNRTRLGKPLVKG